MAEEVNLGRLVAEIALENQSLKESAEEAVEAIESIEDAAEKAKPKVDVEINTDNLDDAIDKIEDTAEKAKAEVNITEKGTDNVTKAVEKIPTEPRTVDVTITVSGVEEAINAINSIPEDPVNIVFTVTGEEAITEAINRLNNQNVQVDTNISDVINAINNVANTLKEQSAQIQDAFREISTTTEETTESHEKSTENIKGKTAELIETISNQENELKRLKSQYSDVVLEQGKNSEAAKTLAERISELSGNLNTNNEKLNNAAYSENDYTDALKDASKAAEEQKEKNEELKEGFTVLKGAISNLASDALEKVIEKFRETASSADKALNSLQTQTGMTNAEISEFKDQMYDLYKQNYGESLEDVAETMAAVQQNIDETDPEKIKEIAKNAIVMNDTFDSDVDETLRGVNALMTNMGLTADEAFDYIARGSQAGLDKTDELSDNLAEYTQIWGQAGFSAQEMFSILQNGIDSGAYNLDKVNDFVKEFTISLSDGRIENNIDNFSDKTATLFERWKSGKTTAAEVFQSVIADLSNMTNQQEALTIASDTWSALGEDNAMSVITALNNVNDTYINVQGTMQEINDIKYDDIESQITALGRQFEVDIIQPIIEGATPQIKEVINWVSEHLPEVTGVVVTLTSAVLGYKAAVSISDILKNVKTAITMLTAARTAETVATQGATVAQTGLNAAMNANPILLLITAIASLVLGIGSYAIAAQSATDDTTKFTQAIEDAKEAAEDTIKQAEIDAEVIKTLGERYEELRKKTNRNTDEQKELDGIAKQLAEKLGITTDKLKDQSGAYKELSEDIENVTKNMIAQAEAQATQELLVESIKAQKEAEEALNAARQKYRDQFNQDDTDEDFMVIADFYQLKLQYNSCTESVEYYKKALTDAYKVQEETAASSEGLSDETDNVKNSLSSSTSSTQKYTTVISGNTQAIDKNVQANQELAASVIGATRTEEELEEETKNFIAAFSNVISVENDLQNAVDEVSESHKLSLDTLNSLVQKYPELIDVVNGYISGVRTEQDVINKLTEVYNNDVENYNIAVKDKIALNTEVYNEIVNNNSKWVDELRNLYGIDLQNYKNAEEAKIAIAKEKFTEQQTINGYTLGMVNGHMYYLPDELLTAEQLKEVEAARAEIQKLEEAEKKFDSYINDYYTKSAESIDLDKFANYGSATSSSSGTSGSGISSSEKTPLEKELEQLEHKKSLGQLTAKQEYEQLVKISNKYALSAEERLDMEERIYNAKKQYQSEEISALDTLGDAVVNALKNKYEQQKELEEKRIDESIESWKKWEEETCDAIQGQIDALDELKEAHDEENERQEYENKRQALELQLAYEKDDYNRKQIEKEIAALDKEEAERLFDLQIEQQKEALQEQMENVKAISSENQEALNEQKDALSEKYESLTSDFALQAEAQKTIINSSQKQIISLINSYAPEYEMAGASLGESLYNGLSGKISDISSYVSAIEKSVDSATEKEKTKAASQLESYSASSSSRTAEINSLSVAKSAEVKSVQSSIDKLAATIDSLLNGISSNAAAYKNQMAVTANAAADKYYATQQYYTSSQSSVTGSTNVYMTVNFNDKVDSPIEVKRQLESVSEQLARQIAGGY